MQDRECVPYAPALIESMRSLGYSFPAAIADLIDNSISARATEIDIISNPGGAPHLIVLDNGSGMSQEKLFEAMRYGSSDPLTERHKDDLGRFGLGMKAASLSQCRKLVVVSKQDNKICGCAWDLDYIKHQKSWKIKVFDENEIGLYPDIDRLKALEHGTYIYLDNFDRIKEGASDLVETFKKCMDDMMNHLSLVFHRFIEEDGLVIRVNGLIIEAKDPFLKYHRATQKKREDSFWINDEKILLKPFILPHLSKLSQEDLDKVGGKEKLRNEQGFYVYRNRRLIIWGTWFRLERKDELSKLARVMVDIPNSLDYMWSIDIKKSTASLPDVIKKNMYSAVCESVLSSESIHTYRGRKETKNGDIDCVWGKYKVREGYEYRINRDIPQLKLLEETLDDKQVKVLNSVLNLLEEAFPVSAVYVDMAKGAIEEKVVEEDYDDKLLQELQEQMMYVESNNLDVLYYYKLFIKVEPYCNSEKVKEWIQEEMKKYE